MDEGYSKLLDQFCHDVLGPYYLGFSDISAVLQGVLSLLL